VGLDAISARKQLKNGEEKAGRASDRNRTGLDMQSILSRMSMAPVEAQRSGHIFLSHAGADAPAARQLAENLRRNGLDVWFDKNSLQPGEPWMAKLEEAISDASAMLVYLGSLARRGSIARFG
jgi:nucleotide-binding universal stress UspA family protein